MSTIINAPDGNTVIYDQEAPWRIWSLENIYMGTSGLNKFVPKVGDHVWNLTTNEKFRVAELINYIPRFEPIETADSEGSASLSAGVGANPDTYRAHLDTTVVPHVMRVDGRLTVAGAELSYARIYRGTDTSSTGRVISRRYDGNGEFIDDKVPLELATLNDNNNISLKYIPSFAVGEDIPEGASVTVVIYEEQGHVAHRRTLFVNHGSFTPGIEASREYITHVSLKSAFLSKTVENQIEVPQNVTLDAINVTGVVHYQSGKTVELPIDGDRMRILGMESFIATQPGDDVPLVLSYKLSPGEQSEFVSNDGKHVNSTYKLLVTEHVGALSVKLAGFPRWRNDTQEYQMRWFLTDLDRSTAMDVTAYVLYNQSSDIFDPVGYGKAQNLSVRLNLKDASQALISYNHTTTQTVQLLAAGTTQGTNWKIAFTPNQDPMFGQGLGAQCVMVNQNVWRVNVRSGFNSFADWLQAFFYNTKPLFNNRNETKAPEPTHMKVFTATGSTVLDISAWNGEFSVGVNLAGQTNLQIEWIKRMGAVDLRLGVTCVPLKQIN
jgi:hypothetical protein